MESNSLHLALPVSNNDSGASTNDDSTNALDYGDSISEPGDVLELDNQISPAYTNNQSLDWFIESKNLENGSLQHPCHVDGELNSRDGNGSFILEQSKSSKRKMKFKNDCLDPASKWFISRAHRSSRERVVKNNSRNRNMKYSEKYHCYSGGVCDRHEVPTCSFNQQGDRRTKDGSHNPTIRPVTNRTESSPDMPRSLFRSSKYNHGCHVPDSCLNPKGKQYAVHAKQIWEPMDAWKKMARSNSNPDITSRTIVRLDSSKEVGFSKDEHQCELSHSTVDDTCSSEFPGNPCKANSLSSHQEGLEDSRSCRTSANKSDLATLNGHHDGFILTSKSDCYSKNYIEEAKLCCNMSSFPTRNGCDLSMSPSSSDNCSSCLSEGDRSTSSSIAQNAGSSSTSDSEDASQQSDGGYVSTCNGNSFHTFPDDYIDFQTNRDVCFTSTTAGVPFSSCKGANFPREEQASTVSSSCNDRGSDMTSSGAPVSLCIPASAVSSSFCDKGFNMVSSQQHMISVHNQSMHVPILPSPTMGYHNQSASSWSATPPGGLMPFPQHNHYMFPGPFGYGLVANQSPDFQIQYNTGQPLATPLLSLHKHSLYQTTNGVYVAGSKAQIKNLNVTGVQQINHVAELSGSIHPLERPSLSRQRPKQPPSARQNCSVGNASKPNVEIPSFSLFHFGVPLAWAAGYCMKPVSRKKRIPEHLCRTCLHRRIILLAQWKKQQLKNIVCLLRAPVLDFHSSSNLKNK